MRECSRRDQLRIGRSRGRLRALGLLGELARGRRCSLARVRSQGFTKPGTSPMSEQSKDGWQDIASAPKDGTPFIGGFWSIRWADSHRRGDVVRCWWQPEFDAFI